MPRDRESLLDILEAAKLAIGYVTGKTWEDFLNSDQCQDAVIRRMAIIGEAARRVSMETRQYLPGLPWDDMIAMRNVLVHEYDDIDMTIVWETVRDHLPPMVQSLERILKSWPAS